MHMEHIPWLSQYHEYSLCLTARTLEKDGLVIAYGNCRLSLQRSRAPTAGQVDD